MHPFRCFLHSFLLPCLQCPRAGGGQGRAPSPINAVLVALPVGSGSASAPGGPKLRTQPPTGGGPPCPDPGTPGGLGAAPPLLGSGNPPAPSPPPQGLISAPLPPPLKKGGAGGGSPLPGCPRAPPGAVERGACGPPAKAALASRTGFEPVRGNPIGFRVQRLNHSATVTPAPPSASLRLDPARSRHPAPPGPGTGPGTPRSAPPRPIPPRGSPPPSPLVLPRGPAGGAAGTRPCRGRRGRAGTERAAGGGRRAGRGGGAGRPRAGRGRGKAAHFASGRAPGGHYALCVQQGTAQSLRTLRPVGGGAVTTHFTSSRGQYVPCALYV